MPKAPRKELAYVIEGEPDVLGSTAISIDCSLVMQLDPSRHGDRAEPFLNNSEADVVLPAVGERPKKPQQRIPHPLSPDPQTAA